MAIDPVCGMQVDAASGLNVELHGQTHYFCSEHCRATFLTQNSVETANSDGVEHTQTDMMCQHTQSNNETAITQLALAVSAAKYICPMHPEVVSQRPGCCPKCGMALECAVPSVETQTIYTCPMHPEVWQRRPRFGCHQRLVVFCVVLGGVCDHPNYATRLEVVTFPKRALDEQEY